MQVLTTPEGWGAVFVEYQPQILQYVYRRTRDRTLAEDITSETFLRAIRGCSIYTDRGHGPRPWLLTLASRLIKDHWRWVRRHPEVPVSEPRDDQVIDNEPEAAALQADTRRQLLALIDSLPRQAQRDCLRLELDGLDRDSIARVLNRTPKAVKCHRTRALAHLRHITNERYCYLEQGVTPDHGAEA